METQTKKQANVTFRSATQADTERIAEIIYGEPGRDAVSMCGGVEEAQAVGHALVQTGLQGWDRTVLGELGEEPLVVLQAGSQIGGVDVTPALAWRVINIFGPIGALRFIPRIRAQSRVNAKAPEGSYHIAELHVDPRHRSRGLGGAALDYAEADAREKSHRHMSLITTTVNPARRLYERHGFRVVETRTDPDYERYTGIPGRVLMVKELA